ncbi:hypothetical protein CHS0354_003955 [Potamilus streckersoni]|uniref:Uncharacterized protein n=1 Tax=Potamilus streckersoni TaxID=2493646 RepID=A0AAE0W8S7_9BIVA|nr:hypothetical protein CHS0354_003955 [Potamilus streckersoni]
MEKKPLLSDTDSDRDVFVPIAVGSERGCKGNQEDKQSDEPIQKGHRKTRSWSGVACDLCGRHPSVAEKFYGSIDSVSTLSPNMGKKFQQSQHIPGCIWRLLCKILAIKTSEQDRPIVGTVVYIVTLTAAFSFTCFGVWFVIVDIRSNKTNTTVHIGISSLLIGFGWLCLGIYSHSLAARLFNNKSFAESVRIHSRTLFKINAAGILLIAGLTFAGLDLYSAAQLLLGSSVCIEVGLYPVVCTLLYSSRALFTVIGTIWNLLVGCAVLSVCRTHTIGIRRFRRELEIEARKYEEYWRNRLLLSEAQEGNFFRRESTALINTSDWIIYDDLSLQDENYEHVEQSPNLVFDESMPVIQQTGSINNSPKLGQSNIDQSRTASQCGSTKLPSGSGYYQTFTHEGAMQTKNPDVQFGQRELHTNPMIGRSISEVIAGAEDEANSRTKRSNSSRNDGRKNVCLLSGSEIDEDSAPPLMTCDKLLLCYWKISNRMRITSQCLQRWFSSWIAFVVLWCGDYALTWMNTKKSIPVLDMLEFFVPVLILLLLFSAYVEVNGEGQILKNCICPTSERFSLMQFFNQQPLQMCSTCLFPTMQSWVFLWHLEWPFGQDFSWIT